MAPEAETGDREIRLVTPAGLSNKLVFQVGSLKETAETEPNDRKGKAVPITQLPVLINGQIMPGDADTFKFPAKQGQHLVIQAAARALIPYLADGVPGWFQATLTLYDAQGQELAYNDDFRFDPDPVLCYQIPADGDYILEIRDAIYRGREDFVYRISLGELPFITHIFPLGATRRETPVTVKVSGINLPENSIQVDVNKEAPCVQYISANKDGRPVNRMPFAISCIPEIVESEPNDQRHRAQRVTVPVIINGRIQAPGDKDGFCFAGKKGQIVSLEVLARRLGSPLDSEIILWNSRGEKLKDNDDLTDKGEGIITHQADSGLIHKLPEDGWYTVELYDVQGKGGDEYAYRLRISPPCPDFELRAVPSSVSVPPGGSVPLTVHAIRQDGFNGEIKIALKENTDGLSLDGAIIPEGTNTVRMTLSAAENMASKTIIPKMEGTAMVDEEPITRPIIPAEDLMQAFIYQHLVPSLEQQVRVTEPPVPFAVSFVLPQKGYLELPLGKEISFTVTAARRQGFEGPIQLQLMDPPKGITIRKGWIPPENDKAIVTLRTESKTEPDLKGNLIINGIMVVDKKETGPVAENDKPKEKKINKERLMITMPAVPFRIIDNPDKKKADESKVNKN